MRLTPLRFIRRLWAVNRVSSILSGPAVPSFQAPSGRLEFTVRCHKFNKDSLSEGWWLPIRSEWKEPFALQGYLAHKKLRAPPRTTLGP